MVLWYFIGSMFASAIFASSALTFTLSNAAGLNSGIAISVWATLPFFAAITEYFMFKTPLKAYQIIGIAVMIIAAGIVSVSDAWYARLEEKENPGQEPVEKDTIPTYIPLLAALLLPAIGGVGSNFTRWVQENKKLSAA